MVTKFWFKARKTIFPWVVDWSDPQDHIRNERDVGKLDYWEWFFMHPTGFTLITYASSISCVFTFGAVAWYLYSIGWFIWVLSVGGSLVFVYDLYVKIKNRKLNKGKTFYDVHMREYEGEEDEGNT